MNPTSLNKLFDFKFYEVKEKVKDLLKGVEYDKYYENKETYRNHVLEVIELLAKEGLGALPYPIEYGGINSMGNYMGVFETLCYYNVNYAVKLGVQFGLFGGAIYQLGRKFHHEQYLMDIGKGILKGCFAMTETGHGSNVKDIETRATYNHGDKTITIHSPNFNAGKEYIGNALHGSLAVVFAQLIVNGKNHGVHAVLVKYRKNDGSLIEGVKVEDCGYKMGLNGIDNGRIWFNNVIVKKENLLNRFGDIDENGEYISEIENPNKRFFTMLGALVGGRITVGLGSTSVAKAALALTINYAHRRRQFRPEENKDEILLIDYPSHQHRLMPLLAKTIILHQSLTILAEAYSEGLESNIRKIETKAAGLKAVATSHCTKTLQECREACGGKGYLWENRLAALKADSDIFTTFEGDNNVLLQLVAKGLLTEFNQSFHDDAFNSTMRYIGGKISFVFSEYNFISSRKTDKEHLLDDDFISDALRYREKKQLITLADRMKAYMKDKMDPHDAFLKCQVHMVDTAKAYIERLAYRDTYKRLQTLKDSEEKKLMEKILRFYGLTLIMENRYFFLENDYMDGNKTKALRRVYSEVMKEITDHSLQIVKAFNIPDELVTIKR